MSRMALLTLPDAGHLYPAIALGHTLVERGHEVTCFNFVTTKAVIRTAGLSFYPLTIRDRFNPPKEAGVRAGLSDMLQGLRFFVRTLLTELPEALRAAKIDALVVDQMDFASGTVADLLGLPFISLSIVPPIYLTHKAPPIGFSWRHSTAPIARIRNCLGNALFNRFLAPVIALVNQQRKVWALPPLRYVNEVFSRLAIITQIPKAMDFHHEDLPPNFFYTGPFHDGSGRRTVSFPWERLRDKPLIYASMGTRRNDDDQVFHAIAEACAGLEVQLIISQGGNIRKIGPLAGDPIVVPFAPQLEILNRASVTITHAGINTTLESLAKGVPLLAMPVADDQPSVAARIERIGAGIVIPYKKLSAIRLRKSILQLLENPRYRAAAEQMEITIRQLDGLKHAADLVESVLTTG